MEILQRPVGIGLWPESFTHSQGPHFRLQVVCANAQAFRVWPSCIYLHENETGKTLTYGKLNGIINSLHQ